MRRICEATNHVYPFFSLSTTTASGFWEVFHYHLFPNNTVMSHYKFIKHWITISQWIEVLSKIDLTQYLNDENIDHLIELLKDVKYQYTPVNKKRDFFSFESFTDTYNKYFKLKISDELQYNEKDNILTVNAHLLLYYNIITTLIQSNISFRQNQTVYFCDDFINDKNYDEFMENTDLKLWLIADQLRNIASETIIASWSTRNSDKLNSMKKDHHYLEFQDILNKLCYVLWKNAFGYDIDVDIQKRMDDSMIDEEFLDFSKYNLKPSSYTKNDAIAQLIIHNLILESPLHLIFIHNYYKHYDETVYHNFVLVDQYYLNILTSSGCSYSLLNINLPYDLLKNYVFPEHLQNLRNKIKEWYYQTEEMKSNMKIMNEHNELLIKFFDYFKVNRPKVTIWTQKEKIEFFKFELEECSKDWYEKIEKDFRFNLINAKEQWKWIKRIYDKKIRVNDKIQLSWLRNHLGQ